MRHLATQRRRLGYRRLGLLLARQGVRLNHKKLYRALQGRSATISEFDEVATGCWLQSPPRACELSAQTLWQANGRSITLLRANQSGDDEPGFDDTFERFAGRRDPLNIAKPRRREIDRAFVEEPVLVRN